MITFFSKFFIREKQDKVKMRQEYGVLCGVVGILLNILLFIGKFIAGTISHSIAITADAINNLSDAGSSIVTLLGFKLAGAKPDTEHPFGHGRIEYVSGLVVAAAILLMAYELVRDSIGKIIHPEETEYSMLMIAILVVSILALIATRPLARKMLDKTIVPTNADRVLHHEAKVTETVDNENATGAVYIDGKTWTARSEDGNIIPKGKMARIVRMEGVKLYVRESKEPSERRE